MTIVYLSPHLDDAVFSCGGIIHEQIRNGEHVEVWTFATMDAGFSTISPYAQSLHARWGDIENPMRLRREEDKKAMALLGCKWLHLDFPDCIYRLDRATGEPLIKTDQDLFSLQNKIDPLLAKNLIQILLDELTIRSLRTSEMKRDPERIDIIAPLAVGNHIDHRLVRFAAEKLEFPLYYFADFPYAAKDSGAIEASLPSKTPPERIRITERGVAAWQDAITCYQSQISSFWDSMEEMKKAVLEYAALPFACTLWKKTTME